MAIRIRHGAFGSYKTASGVEEEIVPTLRDGGIVFTNVRGIDPLKIAKVFKFTADEALDIEERLFYMGECLSDQEKEFIRYFYVWLPKGAMLFLDEAQAYFPDNFKVDTYKTPPVFPRMDLVVRVQKFIADYSDDLWAQNVIDSGSDVQYETLVSRPSNLSDAINMQRHHGWDLILTTPNISLVSKYLRGVAEVAFFQRAASLWLGGFLGGGRFQRTAHQGKYSETNQRYWIGDSELIKIDKRVFQVYQSTATGTFTVAKYKNLFFQWKLWVYVLILIGLIYGISGMFSGLSQTASFVGSMSQGGSKAMEAQQAKAKEQEAAKTGETKKTDPSNYAPLSPAPAPIQPAGTPPNPIQSHQQSDQKQVSQPQPQPQPKVDFKVFGVPFLELEDRLTFAGYVGSDENRRFFFYVDHQTNYTSLHLPHFCSAELIRKTNDYVRLVCERGGLSHEVVINNSNSMLLVARLSSNKNSGGDNMSVMNNPLTNSILEPSVGAIKATVESK
jgi:zona occludens toxin